MSDNNKVVLSGTLSESLDTSSLLYYYGNLTVSIPLLCIERPVGFSSSYVLGDYRLDFTVTLDGENIVCMDDYPTQTPFQAALFALFGTLLDKVSAGASREKHTFKATISVADQEAFNALCMGFAGAETRVN